MKLHTVYQPIIDLKTNEIYGYEALLRGAKPPEVLFSEAISMGQHYELDHIARELAVRSFKSPTGNLFLNCHPSSLEKGITLPSQIDPSRIIIEITEHKIVDYEKVYLEIKRLKSMGVRLAIDDFGSGYANLALIELLKPSFIKLDKIIISNLNQTVKRLITGLKKMADEIGVQLIAEGVETFDQLIFLNKVGVKLAQGYFFGKPHLFTNQNDITEIG